MKFKLLKLLTLFITTSFLFVGCNNKNLNETNDETLDIVTSFYPLYISTINITKDIKNVTVTNMTKAQTGCLHDYQLTPQDLKTLENADVLVVNGAGMESFLDDIISQYPDLKIVDATKGLDLLEDCTHSHDEDEHEHDHEHEHNHDHEDDHEHEHEDEHNHNHEYNPHVWVSISGNIDEVKNISSQLSDLDTENKASYEENTNAYVAKLEDLKNEMHKELDNLTNKNIITFHEAFPYFAKEFNLNIAGVIEVEPDSEPSAKEVEEIINIIKSKNIKALFTEPQYSAKIAKTIANETGANVYELDPIVTGESKPSAYDDYINKMKKNLDVLKEALK